jgi:hypothetical protein
MSENERSDRSSFSEKELHGTSLLAQYGFKYISDAKLKKDKRLKKLMRK